MNKIDWKSKLTSRKFWTAIAEFVTGLLIYLKADAEKVDQIGGLILMGGSVLAYIIGEGFADAARAKTTNVYLTEGKSDEDAND